MKIEHQENNDGELLKKLKEKTFFFFTVNAENTDRIRPPQKNSRIGKKCAFLICLNYIHDTNLYCSHLYVQIY